MGLLSRFRAPLSRAERADLRARIAAAERATAGELAIFVQRRRRSADRGLSLEQLGLRRFHALGMEKTRDRTGILIYLHLAERKLRLVADAGIHAKVSQEEWDALAAAITAEIGAGRLHGGLVKAVETLGGWLAVHCPPAADNANERPDRVELG
jgi:uncharacterized membrane protein YgcG